MTGDYAIYIGVAYVLAAAVLAGIVISSLRDWRKIRAEVEKLDA